MAKSELIFKVPSTVADGDTFSFDVNGLSYLFMFRNNNTGSFIVNRTPGFAFVANIRGLYTASSVNTYFNTSGDFTVINVSDLVVINAKKDGVVFSNFSGLPNFTITNQPESEYSFQVRAEGLFESPLATDKNTTYSYRMDTIGTGTVIDYAVIDGGASEAVGIEAYLRVLTRNESHRIVFYDQNGNTYQKDIPVIHTLNSDLLTFKATRTPEGYTVNVFYDNAIASEYSIDGGVFQSTPLFFNVAEGNHTITVRDLYNGEVSKDIEIEGTFSQKPYYLMSNLNSVRFAKRETVDNCDVFKNINNALSCEEDVKKPYEFVHDLLPCDPIRLQFKTNYRDLNVSIIEDSGNTQNIVIDQKTSYTEISETRDCKVKEVGQYVGMYFTSGNIYNFQSLTVKETYNLNGNLPVWGVIGNFASVFGTYREILDIVYDEDLGVKVLLFESYSTDNTANLLNSIVDCVYDLFNYEVYEFTTLAASFINQSFQFKIDMTDTRFGTVSFLSEKIKVHNDLTGYVSIIARNRTNTDVNYQTGIYHSIRANFIKKYEEPIQENETFRSDNSAYLVSSDNYFQTVFEFEPVTTAVMNQLTAILSCSEVFIDGIGYVKSEAFEIEPALEDTNLYIVIAKMTRTGVNFDKQDFKQDMPLDFTGFDIPALNSSDDAYLSYGNGIVTGNNNFVTY